METKDWLDAIAGNSAQLAVAARQSGYDARVPTCPDWTVADLLDHISEVHRWVTMVFETRAQERPDRKAVPRPPEGTDRLASFEGGVAVLLGVLAEAGPDLELWNWVVGGPADSSFWARRMAHEAVIHRVDVEAAAGQASGVGSPELAADGIDELLGFLDVRRRYQGDEGLGLEGTFHFHATDTPGEWLVEVTPGAVTVRREHAKAPVAVRGPAGPLELFLYNRGDAADLEVLGDSALMDAWRRDIRF